MFSMTWKFQPHVDLVAGVYFRRVRVAVSIATVVTNSRFVCCTKMCSDCCLLPTIFMSICHLKNGETTNTDYFSLQLSVIEYIISWNFHFKSDLFIGGDFNVKPSSNLFCSLANCLPTCSVSESLRLCARY